MIFALPAAGIVTTKLAPRAVVACHRAWPWPSLARAGTAVRYLRSILVPEDEICFLLFEAACEQDVRDVARRADLPFERISEAVTEPMEA